MKAGHAMILSNHAKLWWK